jgi:uncharacterized protein (TIGR02466 family)
MKRLETLMLFPTTILLGELEKEFTKEQMDYVLNLQIKNNIGNLTSKDSYVLENPLFSELKKELEEFAKNYMTIMNYKLATPYITQSWINYTVEGQYHHSHTHSNSFLSGVVYISASEDKDSIKFFNPFKSAISVKPEEYNLYNSIAWDLPVKTKKVILFNSSIEHMVQQKVGNNHRISLGFNFFLKGTLGSEKDLDKLFLD